MTRKKNPVLGSGHHFYVIIVMAVLVMRQVRTFFEGPQGDSPAAVEAVMAECRRVITLDYSFQSCYSTKSRRRLRNDGLASPRETQGCTVTEPYKTMGSFAKFLARPAERNLSTVKSYEVECPNSNENRGRNGESPQVNVEILGSELLSDLLGE